MESKPYVDVVLGPDSYRKIPENKENRNKIIVILLIQNYQNLKFMKTCFQLENQCERMGFYNAWM